MPNKGSPRSVVYLTSYDDEGRVLNTITLTYEQYYDDINPIIDEDEYRATHGIRRLTGQIFNSSGKLQSQFDNTYDSGGALTKGMTTHDDGRVTEI